MTTTQLTIPELTSEMIGNRNVIRDNTQRGEEIVKIDITKIVVRENFNVRQEYGDIQSLANSILENGQSMPGRVDVLNDGTFLLVDGHRRYMALKLLAEGGSECFFKAIVNTAKTTEEQRILQMFTTQDNEQLKPNEVAELIKRLVNLGNQQVTIAKKIGKTPAYVSQMMSFANESQSIKDEVTKGNITVSTVLKLQKEIPIESERVSAISNAVYHKTETMDDRAVTVQIVTGKDRKKEKATEIATAIAEQYAMEDSFIEPLSNLILSYL